MHRGVLQQERLGIAQGLVASLQALDQGSQAAFLVAWVRPCKLQGFKSSNRQSALQRGGSGVASSDPWVLHDLPKLWPDGFKRK